MKKKFYVVWSGREPGIYDSWTACEKQVKGAEGAQYKSFPTRQEAETAFARSPWQYISKGGSEEVKKADWRNLPPHEQPVFPALAVDAACSGNPGVMEFQGVDALTGKQIFHRGPYEQGTNNIGEFLAIVLGLILLQKNQSPMPLYSDSRTALAWVRKKKAATKLQPNKQNAPLMEALRIAENWLQNNTYTTRLLKWDTERWGEIPADFGRK